MKYLCVLALLLALNQATKIDTVTRKINLEARYVTVQSDIKVETVDNLFYHVISVDQQDNLASLHVRDIQKNRDLRLKQVKKLPAEFKNVNPKDYVIFKVDLLQKGVYELEVVEIFKHRKEPMPKTIRLRDEQLVKFDDSKYFLSVYEVDNMKTYVQFDT